MFNTLSRCVIFLADLQRRTDYFSTEEKNKSEFLSSDKHFYTSVRLSASIKPSFQICQVCSGVSWTFHVSVPSSASHPHYSLRRFLLPISSSCHCWIKKHYNRQVSTASIPSCPVYGVMLHLLMLTTAVLPAFFSTWSHSSSSPRILYLKTKEAIADSGA